MRLAVLAVFPVLIGTWALLAIGLSGRSLSVWIPALGEIFSSFALALPLDLGGLARAMGGHCLWFIGFVGLLFSAYGAGWPAVRLVRVRTDLIGKAGLQLALGWGVISFVQHGLGLTGLLFSMPIRIEMGVFVLLGMWALARERPWGEMAQGGPGRTPLILIGIVIAMLFFSARYFPVYDDVRTYHFAAPEHYLFLHKINFEPQQFHWQMPLGCEMVFMAAWDIGGVDLAKLVNVAIAVTGMLLVKSLAESVAASPGVGWWAAFLFAVSGPVICLPGVGKTDLAVAMFAASAAWFGIKAVRGSLLGWLLSAWFLGQAVGVKFTAGFMAVGLLAGLWRYGRSRLSGTVMLASAGAAFLGMSGWLIAGYLLTGNPVHPFLSGLMPDIAWSPFYQQAQIDYMRAIIPSADKTWPALLGGVWRVFGSALWGSFVLFALLPVAFLVPKGRAAGVLKTGVLIGYVFWAPTIMLAHYLSPVETWVAALGSVGMCRLIRERGLPFALAGRAMVVLVFLFTVLHSAVRLGSQGLLYLSGQVAREDIFERVYGASNGVRLWINSLPPDSRILLTGDEKRLWLERRVVSYGPVAEPTMWRLSHDSWSAGEIRKRIRQLGITHHLHNIMRADYWRAYVYPGPAWSGRELNVYRAYAERYFSSAYSPPKMDAANGLFRAFEILEHPRAKAVVPLLLPETEGRFSWMRLLEQRGKFDDALVEWADAAEGMKDVPYARAELAYVFFFMERFHESADLLAQGIHAGLITAKNIDLYSMVLVNLGRYDESVRALVLLAEHQLEPSRPEILTRLGIVFWRRAATLMKQGKYARALKDAEQAVYLWPDDPRPRILATDLCLKLGREGEAGRYAESAGRLRP